MAKSINTTAAKTAVSDGFASLLRKSEEMKPAVPADFMPLTPSESRNIKVELKLNSRGKIYCLLHLNGAKIAANPRYCRVDETKSYKVTHIRIHEDSDWQDCILQEKE